MSVVVLIDGSKWGQVAPYPFIRGEQLRHMITSGDAPAEMVEEMRDRGVRVDIAM